MRVSNTSLDLLTVPKSLQIGKKKQKTLFCFGLVFDPEVLFR